MEKSVRPKKTRRLFFAAWQPDLRHLVALVLLSFLPPNLSALTDAPQVVLSVGPTPLTLAAARGWFQRRETVRQAILIELEARGYQTIDLAFAGVRERQRRMADGPDQNTIALHIQQELNASGDSIAVTLWRQCANTSRRTSFNLDHQQPWPEFALGLHQQRSGTLARALHQLEFTEQLQQKQRPQQACSTDQEWWQNPTLPFILNDLNNLATAPRAHRDATWLRQSALRWADLGRIAENAYGSLHQICKARALFFAYELQNQANNADAQTALAFVLATAGYQKAARDTLASIDTAVKNEKNTWQHGAYLLADWDVSQAWDLAGMYPKQEGRWLTLVLWIIRWNDVNHEWRSNLRERLRFIDPQPTYAIGQRAIDLASNHGELITTIQNNWNKIPRAPKIATSDDQDGASHALADFIHTSNASYHHGAYWHLGKKIIGDIALQIALGWARERRSFAAKPQDVRYLYDHVHSHRLSRLLDLYTVDFHEKPDVVADTLTAIRQELDEGSILLLPYLLLLDDQLWQGGQRLQLDDANSDYSGSAQALLLDADRGTDSTAKLAHYRITQQTKTTMWQQWWSEEALPTWQREGRWPTGAALASHLYSYASKQHFQDAINNPNDRMLTIWAKVQSYSDKRQFKDKLEAACQSMLEWGEDVRALRVLAKTKDVRNKPENFPEWLAINERIMRLPNEQRAAAYAAYAVANEFMRRGAYDQALPYAQRAATSGTAWSLYRYGDLLTRMKRWEDAEQAFKRLSRSDESYSAAWHYWCSAYQRGEQKTAEAFTVAQWRQLANRQRPKPEALAAYATYLLGKDKRELAREKFREAFNTPDDTPSIDHGFMWALTAIGLDDFEDAEKAVAATMDKGFTRGDQSRKAHKLLLQWMLAQWQETGAPPQAVTQNVLAALPKKLREEKIYWLQMQIGLYHEFSQQTDQAVENYRAILRRRARHHTICVLALQRLEHLGFNPELEPLTPQPAGIVIPLTPGPPQPE